MPALARILWGAFLVLVDSLIGRALLALGIGFVEFLGFQYLMDQAKGYIATAMGNVGGSILVEWAGFFMLDVHVTIILSAIGIKMVLNGLGSDRIRKLVPKAS